MRRFLFLLLALVSLTPATAQPLNVAAAASLTEAMRDVAKAFEAARPGVGVQLQFGASGMLLQDIAGGKPADVFASADADTLARGVQRRLLLAEAQREFATNALVLIVPTDRSSPVQRLQDLARPEIRRIAKEREDPTFGSTPDGVVHRRRKHPRHRNASWVWFVIELAPLSRGR